MKRTILATVVLIMLVSISGIAQDGPPQGMMERQFKRLTALRNSTILVEMDLSAQSTKGAALLDLLTRESTLTRDYHKTKGEISKKFEGLPADKALNDEFLTLVEEMESNERLFHEGQLKFQQDLAELFSPAERARFYAADHNFRKELQRIIRGRSGGHRGSTGPRRGPQHQF